MNMSSMWWTMFTRFPAVDHHYRAGARGWFSTIFLQSIVLWYIIESPRLDLFKQCSISPLETSSLSMWTIDPSLFFPCVHFQLNLAGTWVTMLQVTPIICLVMVEFITSHTHRPAQIWLHTSQQINCVVASNDSYINGDDTRIWKGIMNITQLYAWWSQWIWNIVQENVKNFNGNKCKVLLIGQHDKLNC